MSNHSAAITTVPFYGHDLITIQDGDTVRVAMKPICEAIGLQWQAQFNRIKRHPVLSQGVSVMDMPSAGGSQQFTTLPLDMLNGWLFGVDANRVKPEIRESLLMYQRECFQALADYWQKGIAINPRIPLTPEHQRGIQKAIARRAQSLPKGIQRLAYSRIYGHLKDRFGVGSYKDIEDSRYTEALGAIQSYELEGEFLAADPVPDFERLDIDYPLSSWPEINRNIGEDFITRQRTGDYLVAPYHLFGESNHSPTRMVLATLERAGYRVDACKHELLALQIYLEGIIGRLAEIRNIAEGPRAFHRVRHMA